MTHPDEPLWRELEAVADGISRDPTWVPPGGVMDIARDMFRREATHALRREAPWPVAWCIGHRCDGGGVAIVEWPYIEQREQVLDQIWRLRDREQDERQRQREAGQAQP